MPKIAVDEFGNKKSRSILGGRATILCYEKEPLLWHYRQKKKGSKTYLHRALNEPDLASAVRRAEELYITLVNEDKPENALISDAIDAWITIKKDRQSAGQLTEATVKGVRSGLGSVIRYYLIKEKRLNRISDIKKDTFLTFNQWRVTQSWKVIERCGPLKPPTGSTIKRDLIQMKDWYKNFLIPRGYATDIPLTETISVRQDQLESNPPIPLEKDWPTIYRYFEKWATEVEHLGNGDRASYYRQMMRHFVLISYGAGTRPKELLGVIEKIKVPHPEGGLVEQDVVKGGIRWCDVEVEPQTHHTVDGKPFEFLEALIYIKESKTGKPRECPTNTGEFFLRWRRYCDQFRKEKGLPKITPHDYVFFNPFTNRPYPYSQINKSWQQMRTNLSLVLTPSKSGKPYTVYSLRSSYITNQINEGKDVYLIKKITGHSIEVLNRHYDRSDLIKRRAEATARTYGTAAQASKKIDLAKLDAYDKQNEKDVKYKTELVVKQSSSANKKVKK